MRRGEQTANRSARRGEKDGRAESQCPATGCEDSPVLDRSDLVRVTTDTVEGNLLRGMVLVLLVLIFFLVSVRAAVITALTVPLALLFAFIFLQLLGAPANLLSIGAIDFGIIIDGTHRAWWKTFIANSRAPRPELQTARSNPDGGARCGPADFLFCGRYYCRDICRFTH